jgi:hypothetical protein
MAVIPLPPYFSPFPQLKIKLKGRHFDRIEVMEAGLQAVLNTLTEHDFHDAFKKMAEMLGTVHTRGRGLLGGPVDPKLVLTRWQHHRWLFVFIFICGI